MINFFKNLFKKEENKNNKKEKISIQNLDLKGLEKTYYENQMLENIEIPNPQDKTSVKLHTTRGGHIKKLEIDATAIKHIVNEARLAKEADEEQLKKQKLEKLQKTMDDYANIIASKVLERARPKIQEAAEKLINEIEKRNKMAIKEEIEPIKEEITEIKTNIKEIKDVIASTLPRNECINKFNGINEMPSEPELIKDNEIEEKSTLLEIEDEKIKEMIYEDNNIDNSKEKTIEKENQQKHQDLNVEIKTEEKTESIQKQENIETQEDPENQIKAILQKAKEKKQQNSNKKDDTKKQSAEQNDENKQDKQTKKPDEQKLSKTNNTQDDKNNIIQDKKDEKRKKKIEKMIKDIKANIKLIEGMKKEEEKEKELKILKQLINNEFKNDKEAIEIILKETNLEEIENKLKSVKEESTKEEPEKKNSDQSANNIENKAFEEDSKIKEQKINYYQEEVARIKDHIKCNLDSLKSQYIYMIVEKFKEKIEKEPDKNEILAIVNPELTKIVEIAKEKEEHECKEDQNKNKKTNTFDVTLEENTKKETKVIHNLLEKTKELKNLDQQLIKMQEIEMEKEENDSIFK